MGSKLWRGSTRGLTCPCTPSGTISPKLPKKTRAQYYPRVHKCITHVLSRKNECLKEDTGCLQRKVGERHRAKDKKGQGQPRVVRSFVNELSETLS